jgi:hypothetical protein
MVKAHERGALDRGDDIVWATGKPVEAGIKSLAITNPLDYQVAQAAATSTTINSLMMPSVDGSTDSAYLGTFFMAPVWQTGLCDTANTAANVVGACFIRGDTNPTTAWGGACMVRDVRTEMARPEIEKRETKFVGTAKWGVAQIAAESAVKIVTDA